MTEQRPRPQYGEYASPQAQAQAIAGSLPPIIPAPTAPHPVTAAAPARSAGSGVRMGGSASRPKSRRWDLILSLVLLAYGALNVVAQIFQATDLATVLSRFYTVQGIGTFTPTELSSTLGIVLNVITVVVFLATVAVTSTLLRRGRLAFYVPIVGGALALLVALVFVMVLLSRDPSFTAYINGSR